MSAQAIVAPTDPQLEYIKSLCAEREYPQPVVYSKQHASELISALLDRSYHPPEWREDVPF